MTAPNAAFWKWFHGSAVVDKRNHLPLVVYHGSPDVRGLFAEGFRSLTRGEVFFATSSARVAETYADDRRAFDYQNAEPGVVPLYLAIKNPMVIHAGGKGWYGTEKYVAEAKAKGHDGIIIHDSVDDYQTGKKAKPSTVYAFFKSSQAKSAITGQMLSRVDRKPIAGATANDGTWDAGDPKITSNPPSTFWGRAGAGVLFHCTYDDTYLLVRRSRDVEQPGTWGVPGGACGKGGFYEDSQGRAIPTAQAWKCAQRETIEELSWLPVRRGARMPIVYQKGKFRYTTFIVDVDKDEKHDANIAIALNWENDEFRWFSLAQMAALGDKLHFGVQYVLQYLRAKR
jgi:8-oxo-dGTP pyrophosphatase MutT (NUDIX family)